MQIKNSTHAQLRQFIVANTIASSRIEGIIPTKRLEQNLIDYVAGKKSIGQIIEEAKQRYILNSAR